MQPQTKDAKDYQPSLEARDKPGRSLLYRFQKEHGPADTWISSARTPAVVSSQSGCSILLQFCLCYSETV